MTVHAEIPVIDYVGNGIATSFTFEWSSSDTSEIYVTMDGTDLKEGVEYELEDYDPDFGGSIVFNEPPAADVAIRIYRDTPVTQEVDYREGDAFPADTHEFQMDKDTRILQEIIEGGRAIGGNVDLEADQQPEYTDIENTAGADARVLPWTTDGLKSGVALGEVVPAGETPPVDGEGTTKPNGYVWWVLGQPDNGGGDPNITMWTAPIVVNSDEVSPNAARAELAYDASVGDIGYGYDESLPTREPEWTTQEVFLTPVMAAGSYLVQLELVGGVTPSGSAVDSWLDAASDASWFVTNGEFLGILHVAPDAGGGTPDETFKISRYVTLHAEVT